MDMYLLSGEGDVRLRINGGDGINEYWNFIGFPHMAEKKYIHTILGQRVAE